MLFGKLYFVFENFYPLGIDHNFQNSRPGKEILWQKKKKMLDEK